MIILQYRDARPHDYRADELVEIMAKHGYAVSPSDAERAWTDYSEIMAAGWLAPNNDDEVLSAIRSRCAEVPPG